jgi:hypothetical protein
MPAAGRAPSVHQPPDHRPRVQPSRYRGRPAADPHRPRRAGPLPTPPRHRLRALPLRPRPHRGRDAGRRTRRDRGRPRLSTRHRARGRPYRRLPEILRVNGFFAALVGYARRHPDAELAVWWPQWRCQATWGRLIQPQGFGRWRDHGTVVDFFLECDHGEEPISITAALAGYDDLADAVPSWPSSPCCGWSQPSEKPRSAGRSTRTTAGSPRPRRLVVATPPTRCGSPLGPLARVDAWAAWPTPTAGRRSGREPHRSSRASEALGNRWAIETRRVSAATARHGAAARGYPAPYGARGFCDAAHPCGRSGIACRTPGWRGVEVTAGSR